MIGRNVQKKLGKRRKRKMKKGESSDEESDGDFWSRNPIKRLGGKDENSAMGKFYL